MPAATKSPLEPPVAPGDGSPALGDYLDRFRQIAAMVEVLDHLPDYAGDIRDWRSHGKGERPQWPPRGRKDEIWRSYGDLGPVTQRAFEAVVAGIDKLADSAVDLCDHTHRPPTPDEIKAGAEIGQSMRQLLDRAMALVDSAGARRHRPRHDRQSPRK
jgi:hypothetical protein